MQEGLRSPTVYNPKTVGEAVADKLKNKSACFWAGGTFLMSRPGFFPNIEQPDIISLKGISDLTKIYHSDRFIEIGAMVSIQQLVNMGGYLFPKKLNDAILSIGSSIIRNQATVGGALCTKNMRFSLCCIFATLNAQVEICTVSKVASLRWVPISRLYDRNGEFLYDGTALLTKIRIPTDSKQLHVFRTLGLPMQKPNEAVIFGLQYAINHSNLMHPNLCLVFPSSCFYISQDFDNLLSSLSFPLSQEDMSRVAKRLISELKASSSNATPIQLERAFRLFVTVLNDINTEFLLG